MQPFLFLKENALYAPPEALAVDLLQKLYGHFANPCYNTDLIEFDDEFSKLIEIFSLEQSADVYNNFAEFKIRFYQKDYFEFLTIEEFKNFQVLIKQSLEVFYCSLQNADEYLRRYYAAILSQEILACNIGAIQNIQNIINQLNSASLLLGVKQYRENILDELAWELCNEHSIDISKYGNEVLYVLKREATSFGIECRHKEMPLIFAEGIQDIPAWKYQHKIQRFFLRYNRENLLEFLVSDSMEKIKSFLTNQFEQKEASQKLVEFCQNIISYGVSLDEILDFSAVIPVFNSNAASVLHQAFNTVLEKLECFTPVQSETEIKNYFSQSYNKTPAEEDKTYWQYYLSRPEGMGLFLNLLANKHLDPKCIHKEILNLPLQGFYPSIFSAVLLNGFAFIYFLKISQELSEQPLLKIEGTPLYKEYLLSRINNNLEKIENNTEVRIRSVIALLQHLPLTYSEFVQIPPNLYQILRASKIGNILLVSLFCRTVSLLPQVISHDIPWHIFQDFNLFLETYPQVLSNQGFCTTVIDKIIELTRFENFDGLYHQFILRHPQVLMNLNTKLLMPEISFVQIKKLLAELSFNCESHAVIYAFFKNYPAYLEKINGHDFLINAGTSFFSLYHLAATEYGQMFVALWYETLTKDGLKPDACYFFEALCGEQKQPSKEEEGTSAFYFFAQNELGMSLLNAWLSNHPEDFIEAMSPTLLKAIRFKHLRMNSILTHTVIQALTKDETSLQFFYNLLELKPELYRTGFSTKSLTAKVFKENITLPAFHLLTRYTVGLMILDKITQNSIILKAITMSYLLYPGKVNDKPTEDFPLLNLSLPSDGCLGLIIVERILSYYLAHKKYGFFVQDTELTRQFSQLKYYSLTEDFEDRVSICFYWSVSSVGRRILKNIINQGVVSIFNSQYDLGRSFFSYLRLESLFTKRALESYEKDYANTCAFQWLCHATEDHDILHFIIKHKEGFFEALNEEILFEPFIDKKSAFDFLVESALGLEIVEEIIKARPEWEAYIESKCDYKLKLTSKQMENIFITFAPKDADQKQKTYLPLEFPFLKKSASLTMKAERKELKTDIEENYAPILKSSQSSASFLTPHSGNPIKTETVFFASKRELPEDFEEALEFETDFESQMPSKKRKLKHSA